jgi:hypothetical protein
VSTARDIAAMYRGPRPVLSRKLAGGLREDRALAWAMAACVLMFVAQLPALAREAHLSGEDLSILMGGALLGLVFVLPLFLYALAFAAFAVARAFGGQGNAGAHRTVLFWALLSATPLLLLRGLVTGFLGPGPEQTLVDFAWLAAFLWFWGTGLWMIGRGVPA